MRELDAGDLLEIRARQMLRAANADRAVIEPGFALAYVMSSATVLTGSFVLAVTTMVK